MSILCPGSYGEFAVTITKECFGAKFQILPVSFCILVSSCRLCCSERGLKGRHTILYISFALQEVVEAAHLVSDDVRMVAEISQPVPQIVQAGSKPVTSFCRSSCDVGIYHRDKVHNRVTPPRTTRHKRLPPPLTLLPKDLIRIYCVL